MTADHDLAQIELALGRLFPALRVAPLGVLETGFDSLVVETRDGAIFRVARHASAAEGHAREAKLLPVLGPRLPVEVPRPEWRVEPGPPAFPFGAMGYRRLAGKPLRPDWLVGRHIRQVASELAAFLVELHRFPLEEAERLGLPRSDRNGRGFEALRDEVMPLLGEALPRAEYDVVSRWCDEFGADEALERFDAALRHGDLWFGNVLVDEASRAVVGVLDWTSAAIGDPAADLARQLHLGESFAEAVLSAYEDRAGRVDRTLRHRIRRRWELLEFAGIRTAVELDDPEELEETIAKLRAGPILSRGDAA